MSPYSLTTYTGQVNFSKRWIKEGSLSEIGTWRSGMTWGKLWGGIICGYIINLQTIGDTPWMKAGSFSARALSEKELKQRNAEKMASSF
jgi:hypothetical protein